MIELSGDFQEINGLYDKDDSRQMLNYGDGDYVRRDNPSYRIAWRDTEGNNSYHWWITSTVGNERRFISSIKPDQEMECPGIGEFRVATPRQPDHPNQPPPSK